MEYIKLIIVKKQKWITLYHWITYGQSNSL